VRGEAAGAFGFDQRAAEIRIDLGQIEGRCRRDFADFVRDEIAERGDRGIHLVAFFAQAAVERLLELGRGKAFVQRSGQRQRRTRRDIPGTIGSFAAGRGVEANDLFELIVVSRRVARGLEDCLNRG
jgi:hypothetical protein